MLTMPRQGDLGRYRMAIEDNEPKDREVWCNVARFWYNKATDKRPNIGRLYHHLAILGRPSTLEQLSLYARALTCETPFESTKGSIMELFDPTLQSKADYKRSSSLDILIIGAHASLFKEEILGPSNSCKATVFALQKGDLFHKHVDKAGPRFKKAGACAAISNIAALFEYGTPRYGAFESRLRHAYEKAQKIKGTASKFDSSTPEQAEGLSVPEKDCESDTYLPRENHFQSVFIAQSSRLASVILWLSLKRTRDENVYPLVHIHLVFIWSLLIAQEAWRYFENDIAWSIIERDIPWSAICAFLNILRSQYRRSKMIFAQEFPQHSKEECDKEEYDKEECDKEQGGIKEGVKEKRHGKEGDKRKDRPLPEDFILRGQVYSQSYFPEDWFMSTLVDDDESTLELSSMAMPRKKRILWLGCRIASVCYTTMKPNDLVD